MNAVVRSGQRWVWKVVGKGRKAVDAPDRVTLNEAAMNALMRYRIARGLPAYPDSTEKDVPLIAKLTPLRIRKNRQLATGPGVSAIARQGTATLFSLRRALCWSDLPRMGKHTCAAQPPRSEAHPRHAFCTCQHSHRHYGRSTAPQGSQDHGQLLCTYPGRRARAKRRC